MIMYPIVYIVVEDRMSVITCSECELEGGRVGACRYPLSFWLQEPIFEAPIGRWG